MHFDVYPNPATDLISLKFDYELFSLTAVEVLNSIGQKVKDITVTPSEGTNIVTISIKDLVPGSYLLKVFSINSNASVLIIKN